MDVPVSLCLERMALAIETATYSGSLDTACDSNGSINELMPLVRRSLSAVRTFNAEAISWEIVFVSEEVQQGARIGSEDSFVGNLAAGELSLTFGTFQNPSGHRHPPDWGLFRAYMQSSSLEL